MQVNDVDNRKSGQDILLRDWLQHFQPAQYVCLIFLLNTEESGRHQLGSPTTNAAVAMSTRTQFGKRAFSVCGPKIWN